MEKYDMRKPLSPRNVAVRELLNGSRNLEVQHPIYSHPFKATNLATELPKTSGVKRSYADSFGKYDSSSCTINTGGQPEYQLRKTESESCKMSKNTHPSVDNRSNPQRCADGGSISKGEGPQESSKPSVSFSTFIPVPIVSMVRCNSSLVAYAPGNHIIGVPAAVADSSVPNAGIPTDSQLSKLHWKERFLRLQEFLKTYDRASQGNYIQMLRSLSPAGRSKHAVELEKRAIQLLIEEGRELNRMKALNILGKGLPMDQ